MPIVFGFGQTATITAAIVYAVVALTIRRQEYWLEPLFFGAFQADVAINVCHIIHHIISKLTLCLVRPKSSLF